nr:hypothetical protein [Candidatus Dadabacteria bacterium]
MDAKLLDEYFDEWIEDKEKTNCINGVYGQCGLMAIMNFILFVKDKEYGSSISYRESCQRDQANYSGAE